jgi:DNA-binding response OmpR family regulator
VHSVRPDVVTLDVVMPRLDGVRTAARLRADADPWTRGVGIVMVSGGTAPEGVGGPGGADAFVPKPFEPAELVETVRRLVRRNPGAQGAAPPGGSAGGGTGEAGEPQGQAAAAPGGG